MHSSETEEAVAAYFMLTVQVFFPERPCPLNEGICPIIIERIAHYLRGISLARRLGGSSQPLGRPGN